MAYFATHSNTMHIPTQSESIPGPVVTLATSLGIRLDGTWPATRKTPAMLNATSLRANALDRRGDAVGASFCVACPATPQTFLAAYSACLRPFLDAAAESRAVAALDRDLIRPRKSVALAA